MLYKVKINYSIRLYSFMKVKEYVSQKQYFALKMNKNWRSPARPLSLKISMFIINPIIEYLKLNPIPAFTVVNGVIQHAPFK